MHPEWEKEEFRLYQGWDVALTQLFDQLAASKRVVSRKPAKEAGEKTEVRSYRERVGQDLKAFQEKLTDIMESEKNG